MSLVPAMKAALGSYCMHNHSGMQEAISEGMSWSMAYRIATEYGPCNAASLQIMAAGLSKVWDLDLAYTLVENIYDESGRGRREDSHIAMFEKYMVAVGVDPTKCSVIPGSRSEQLIQIFMAVRDEPTEYEALALMHGFEAVFPYICGGIYKALMKSKAKGYSWTERITEETAFFFLHHSEADIEHSGRMLDALDKAVDTEDKRTRCLSVSIRGAWALYTLFDAILRGA